MEIESNDIIVFKPGDNLFKSRVSKVDGNIVKLIDENGSYRQMSTNNLEDMIQSGFASIEKHIYE